MEIEVLKKASKKLSEYKKLETLRNQFKSAIENHSGSDRVNLIYKIGYKNISIPSEVLKDITDVILKYYDNRLENILKEIKEL